MLEIAGHRATIDSVDCVAVSRTSLLLASSSEDGTVRVWHVAPTSRTPDASLTSKVISCCLVRQASASKEARSAGSASRDVESDSAPTAV